MKLAPFLIIALLIACTRAPVATQQTEQAALAALQSSPTYTYDGQNTTILTSASNEVLIGFVSRHAGYGDRSQQALPQQLTLHTATVHLQDNKAVSIIIDGIWNETAQRPIRQEIDGMVQSAVQQSCSETVAPPLVSYSNGSVHGTYFTKATHCGNMSIKYKFDNSVYPPTLIITPGETTATCKPLNCPPLGVATFSIPAREVGTVIVRAPNQEYTIPIGSFRCTADSCPEGYLCAHPERGGICVINSTESTDVLYERYVNLTK